MPFRLINILFFVSFLQGITAVYAQEEGLASYYHPRFNGRKSASGERHNSDDYTAEHRTYPFGTYLRITKLSTLESVIVRVTDRGPYRKGRIVDVSSRVAEELGFKRQGMVRGRVEEVPGQTDGSRPDRLEPNCRIAELRQRETGTTSKLTLMRQFLTVVIYI